MVIGSDKRPEIFRHEHLSRVGSVSNAVAALAGATVFACCIICPAGHGAYADSRPRQQTRDLGAVGSVKKEVPCNQLAGASPASFDPLFEVSAASVGGTIVGIASWYNPYVELDNTETASGELYDPDKWTAAIQIDLRGAFGGVGFGKDYRVAYALVESGAKRMIVKINDVGPLKPGRVIDLNERAMRRFDETLLLGLLPDIKVTALPSGDWTPGPIVSEPGKTYGCEPRDARRDNSPKTLSALESSEPQMERQQRLDAPTGPDQHRGAAPSPRIRASDPPDRAARARSSRRARYVSEEMRYLGQ